MEAEFAGLIPELMETLKAEGPYAYTIMPEILPDGTVKSPILRTREEIASAYRLVRGMSDLLSSEALIEITGSWYQFTEAITRGRRKGQNNVGRNHVISLFPVSGGSGITGELVWVKVDRSLMGFGAAPEDCDDEIDRRRKLLSLHDRYCAALKAGDAHAVVDTLADGAQGAIRDYVLDTGTLVELDGKPSNLQYYEAFFSRYEIRSVDMLQRVAQDWYIFAELRLEVSCRRSGQDLAFHIAEFLVPAKDGRFIIRVGHGTDPAGQSAENN